jgi:hypothetical protein
LGKPGGGGVGGGGVWVATVVLFTRRFGKPEGGGSGGGGDCNGMIGVAVSMERMKKIQEETKRGEGTAVSFYKNSDTIRRNGVGSTRMIAEQRSRFQMLFLEILITCSLYRCPLPVFQSMGAFVCPLPILLTKKLEK